MLSKEGLWAAAQLSGRRVRISSFQQSSWTRSTLKRILYVEVNEDHTVGGSHKVQYDLVTRLSPDFDPLILHYQDNIWSSRLRDEGLEVITWDDVRDSELAALKRGGWFAKGRLGIAAVRRRLEFIKSHGVHAVHLNNSPFVGYDDWLPASLMAGIPCTTYAMGDAFREPRATRRFAVRRFATHFAVSRYVEQALLSNGIPKRRILLTYPGVDLEAFDRIQFRPSEQVRLDLGVGSDQVLALMVGNIRRWKGQHVVVEALAQLASNTIQNLKVLFVGQGGTGEHADYREELDAAVDRAGLGDTVVFTGRREDVPDMLEAADIAIHASIIPEPFGLVVQEAMLHGCAVIAAAAGGPVEMLDDSSGRVFDSADPSQLTANLTQLVHDRDLRETLARNARAKAREFDVRRHVELIQERYRELLGR